MAAQGTHPIPSHHYTATDPLFSSHISNNVYYSPQEGNRPPESESNIASEQYQMEGELQFDTEGTAGAHCNAYVIHTCE